MRSRVQNWLEGILYFPIRIAEHVLNSGMSGYTSLRSSLRRSDALDSKLVNVHGQGRRPIIEGVGLVSLRPLTP